MRVRNVTGTVILASIAAVFGVDAVLNANDVPTISEWFHNWLTGNPAVNLPVLGMAVTVLVAHFWWFRPQA